MQHQLSLGPLLDEKGHLIEAGYHTKLIKEYQRSAIKVKGLRIKEWDYYYVGNDRYGIALTIADNDYLWLTSVTLFDFVLKNEHTSTQMGFLPKGKLKLPESSTSGNTDVHFKNHQISFHVKGKQRIITASIQKFQNQETLNIDLVLEPTIQDSMVIATPFEKPTHFYYNQKINLLKAKGTVKINNQTYDFNDCYGVLDWGRGVWTYKNTWYWSSMSGVSSGVKIGFNLGYGFGNTSQATENMLFVDQQTYKFEDVVFSIPQKDGKDDYMSLWEIHSKSKDIHLTFTPILDRYSKANLILLKSIQHQVFGLFNGTFQLPNGNKIEIKDMIGFAEKVTNHW